MILKIVQNKKRPGYLLGEHRAFLGMHLVGMRKQLYTACPPHSNPSKRLCEQYLSQGVPVPVHNSHSPARRLNCARRLGSGVEVFYLEVIRSASSNDGHGSGSDIEGFLTRLAAGWGLFTQTTLHQ